METDTDVQEEPLVEGITLTGALASDEGVTSAPNPLAIVKEDAKALSDATSIEFIWTRDAASIINACKTTDDATYGPQVLNRTIKCSASVEAIATPVKCRFLLEDTTDVRWQTVVNSLRAGDVLTVDWRIGTENAVLSAAGIVRDELHLIVSRFDGRGRGATRVMKYFIADSIVANHDQARICSFI